MEKIHVGDTVEGTVKNVTDFGAFIDLGGADGLLHISEMSWGRVENPKKVFTVGETVKVMIKDIKGEKIALTMKFPEENPFGYWEPVSTFQLTRITKRISRHWLPGKSNTHSPHELKPSPSYPMNKYG